MAMLGTDMVGIVTETMIRGYDFLWREVDRLKKYMERNNYATFKAMRDSLVPKFKTAQSLELTEAVVLWKKKIVLAAIAVCRSAIATQLK